MGPNRPPLIHLDDLGLLVGVPMLGAIAWCLPLAAWPAFCASFGPLNRATLAFDSVTTVQRIDATRGSRLARLPAHRLIEGVAGEDLHGTMLALRSYRPGARLRIETMGTAHLQAALRAGRGAILWIDHTTQGAYLAKAGLAQAGFGVSHLSHPRHGFSGSRFGMRYLNRLRTAAEDRHLAERVKIALGGPTAAVRHLLRRLRDNQVISVTARADGSRPIEAPFMDGTLALAPGAPSMAVRTGAALLPVHALRVGHRFEVHIEPPLHACRAPADAAALARAYAARLERAVLDHPTQWLGWLHL